MEGKNQMLSPPRKSLFRACKSPIKKSNQDELKTKREGKFLLYTFYHLTITLFQIKT